jgi:hypothetical protein
MTYDEIEALFLRLAAEKATHDGDIIGPLYYHAAAHELTAMLRQALDRAIYPPRAPEPVAPLPEAEMPVDVDQAEEIPAAEPVPPPATENAGEEIPAASEAEPTSDEASK